jgi:hypothetical protein
MLNTARESRLVSRMLVLAFAALLALPVAGKAQDEPKKPAAETAAEKKAPRAKPRGRLPAHYGRVVSSKQREAIYKLQAEFTAKIAALKAEMAKLLETRDKEVEAVLTADQRRQVVKLREDAKAAREARAKAKADAKTEASGETSETGDSSSG